MAGDDRGGGFGIFTFEAMRLSIYENDGTLGELYGTARFHGQCTGMGFSEEGVRDRIIRDGWGVSALSIVSAGWLTNVHSYTISINAICGMNRTTIANGIKQSLRNAGFVDVTCYFDSASGCEGSDLVAGGSVFTVPTRTPTPRTPAATTRLPVLTATVNVPISFDDDPTAKENIGFLDTLKGLDTTTWILIAVAGVLVLKRL